MAELTYRTAIARGIAQEMERDSRVVFIGEDIGAAGGVFKTTVGLFEQFGPERVRDTPISAVIPVAHPAADRASAYGLDSIVVDGNDVDAVYEIAVETVGRARRGEGPSLVEALTYRHKGHSRADPGKYRPDEEVAAWMARDPLPHYRARLERLGFPVSVLDEMERRVLAEVDEATEAVRAGSPPDPAALLTDVWANGGSEWRN